MACLQCGEPTVVAPTGQVVLQLGEARGPLCTRCAPSEAFDTETIARSLHRPGVLDEIKAELERREPSR